MSCNAATALTERKRIVFLRLMCVAGGLEWPGASRHGMATGEPAGELPLSPSLGLLPLPIATVVLVPSSPALSPEFDMLSTMLFLMDESAATGEDEGEGGGGGTIEIGDGDGDDDGRC